MNTAEILQFPSESGGQERRVVDTENGYTRIANELLEAVIGSGLTQNQLLITLAVIRKTYGYNKSAGWVFDQRKSRSVRKYYGGVMLDILPNETRSDCLIWTGAKNDKGYGRLTVKGETISAHRFSYCVANGLTLKEIEGLVIRHRCDVPSCINPTHLETGTPMDNVMDRVARRRSASGERSGSAKLTEAQVEEIISTYIPRHPEFGGVAMGKKYGVYQSTISKIIVGTNWKNRKS